MPGRDATGPFGTGPLGRGLGPCGGGGAYRGRGFGFGRGWGFSRGWGSGFQAPVNETEVLKDQKSWLEQQLAAIAKRLEDLGE